MMPNRNAVAVALLSFAAWATLAGCPAPAATPSSEKALTAFAISTPNAQGTIDENAKTVHVSVPFGTTLTGLVATFTTTGSSVTVGGTEQVSGTTANDFSNPVTYVVTAADETTASYTVTVVAAALSVGTNNNVVSFSQTRQNHSSTGSQGDFEIFPGQSNVWDMNNDLTLDDGSDDQFDGALSLDVDGNSFNSVTFSDLTFIGPSRGAADGVLVAAVSAGGFDNGNTNDSKLDAAIAGTYSAFINAGGKQAIYQRLDLSAATGTLTLTWQDNGALRTFAYADYLPKYQVNIRDSAGNLLETIFETNASFVTGAHSVDVSSHAGQVVVLSFENRSEPFGWVNALAVVDDVSLLDGSAHEYVANGNFETGSLAPWAAAEPSQQFGYRTAEQTLVGLSVARSFYTEPTALWGRFVDTFHNPSGAPISVTVTYSSNLGSDGDGVIYELASGRALASWDAFGDDRDVGVVWGDVTSRTFTSVPSPSADDDFYHTYDITVPAGGTVALAQFVILGNYNTQATAGTDVTAHATEIDTEATRILANFWTDASLREGLDAATQAAITNIPH